VSVLLNNNTRVLVQGITGAMGRFQCAEMIAYGTNVVAGVSPGKGGRSVEGIPVFDTASEAVTASGADMSIIFVGPPRAKTAIIEAAHAGLRCIVCVTEFMPVHDVIEARDHAQRAGVRLVGPNCSGLITPGVAKLGFYCDSVCMPGDIGVASKSGTLSYAVLLELKRHGIGASTVIGVGGDEVKGTTFADCVEMFEADPATRAILLIGEIGGCDEEIAADYIARKGTKPVVAFVSGRTVPSGQSIGHAGAIIVGSKGTHEGKIKAFKAAGVRLAVNIEEIPNLLRAS
jgi:succinyl-CoA synthetase alpha subunit